MRLFPRSRAGLAGLAILSLTTSAAAHSWIESAYKIDAATRKFFGAPGYPRGGNFRRLSAEDGVTDGEYINRIPENGVYTGNENINKRPITQNFPNETLEAAPGDYIAILHLENGHVTTKAEGRPLNSGTIFLYGTSEPKDEDRLFDIHLIWNKDGTGGDGRGKLLGTRNYDDSQCYEGNPASQVAVERSAKNKALPADTLACQSDIQLPKDLKPGSTYTIYWYWDWPTLNTDEIDMEGTKKGLFPWMGTFMRGEKDPHGFTEAALATNESYSSTIDIKIVDKDGSSGAKALPEDEFAGKPDVYKMAINSQLKDGGFQVEVDEPNQDGGGSQAPASSTAAGGDRQNHMSSTAAPSATAPTAPIPAGTTQVAEDGPITVTVTRTVDPPAPTSTQPASPTTPCGPGSTKTVMEIQTQYTTVYPEETSATEEAGNPMPIASTEPTTMVTSTVTHPTSTLPDLASYFAQPTAFKWKRRSKWSFGEH